MDPQKFAKAYNLEVLPMWDGRFVPFITESFPTQLAPKCTLLEVGCTTGLLTEEIVTRMPATSRLIAVEDIRELMDQARRRVAEEDRKRVFFKKERPDKLSFADEAFDGVLSGGLAPAYRLDVVLAEAARLLRKDGFALLGAPMQGSFQELIDIFREVLEKEDLIQAQEGLDRFTRRLPDRLTASRELTRAGLVDGRVRLQEEFVFFENGLSLVSSPLVREHCLDACLALIKDRGWREGVLAGMIRTLDTYFPEGVEITIIMGCLEGTKH